MKNVIACVKLLIPVCWAVGWLGCGPASDDGKAEEAVGTNTEKAAVWNFTSWQRQGNAYPLSVCFRQTHQSGGTATPDWAGDKARAQSAMAATWDAHSALSFQFQGDCASNPPSSWMPINLHYDSTAALRSDGFGVPGDGNRLSSSTCFDCQVQINYGSAHWEFETIVVHEVGHALGFRHERSRADFPECRNLEAPPCTSDAQCNISTEHCVNGFCYVKQELDTSGTYITANWDRESVMNNWECYDARVHDSFPYYFLSHGDKVAVGILYPDSLARGAGSIGSWRGFHTTNGTLVRTDGSVVPDWAESGAATSLFNSMNWYRWVGAWSWYSSAVEAPPPASGTWSVKFTFTDFWGRANSGVDTVIVDNNQHTGVLMSTLEI